MTIGQVSGQVQLNPLSKEALYMERFTAFESSSIASASYEASSEILEIGFYTSGTYQYFDVPLNKWEDFKRAASKGTYFNQFIKPFHSYAKI